MTILKQAYTQLTDAEETELLAMFRIMKQIVEDAGPDFVYQKRDDVSILGGCVYVYNGEPDCLVGRVLARMGVPLNALRAWEGKGVAYMASGYGSRLAGPVNVSDQTISCLSVAQEQQDRGKTWGFALNSAVGYAHVIYGVTIS